ncbi:hypothetical protein EZS27_016741 [termite gut metagenome]|uniref:Uncharacterized protein n=1 Tax=termite gut metagenome TaxID=433724 RepID=A0A5J4RNB8_9ZZZZ
MKQASIQWLFEKSNVARGNRTSPVQTSCPAGLLAENQQDDKNKFYKGFYDFNP